MERRFTHRNGGAKCVHAVLTPTNIIPLVTKVIILTLISLIVWATSLRANTKDVWKKGVVVLNNNEVLIAKIKFYEADDILLVKKENDKTGIVYTAAKVRSFQISDSVDGSVRRFISFMAPRNKHKKLFYESMVEGRMNILKREAAFGPNVYINYENETTTLKEFKRKVLPQLKKQHNQAIENFMAEHRLNLNFSEDLMKLAHYLNQLNSQELVMKE